MDTAHRRKDSTVRFVEAGEEGGGGGEVGGASGAAAVSCLLSYYGPRQTWNPRAFFEST